MNKKAQVRWFIIAALLAIVAGMLFYHDATVRYLGALWNYAKPITGYATGIAKQAVHNVTG